MRLEHMFDLPFAHPQIKTTVEYHFGVGLSIVNCVRIETGFKSQAQIRA